MAELQELLNRRIDLENALQRETSEISGAKTKEYDDEYVRLQRGLAAAFKDAHDDPQRITIMLEMMRILENRLVYLQNCIVDPTSDTPILAQLVTRFIDQLQGDGSTVLTTLEATYYRAVAALYSADLARALDCFCPARESGDLD